MNLRRFALLITGTAVAAATLLVTAGVGAAAPAAPATTSSFTLPAAAGAGTAHCTVTALLPTGTLNRLDFPAEYHCDIPVGQFRLIVQLESMLEDGSAWPGSDLAWQDFSGGTSGRITGTIHDGDLPDELAPWTLRGAARAFIINEDQSATFVGRSVSTWTPPLS